jgi:hypothetical protein
MGIWKFDDFIFFKLHEASSRVDRCFRVQDFQEWLLFSWEKIGSLIFKLHEASQRDSLQESKDCVHLWDFYNWQFVKSFTDTISSLFVKRLNRDNLTVTVLHNNKLCYKADCHNIAKCGAKHHNTNPNLQYVGSHISIYTQSKKLSTPMLFWL